MQHNRESSLPKPRHFARTAFWYVVLGVAVVLLALFLMKVI
jgi:hypothetical protein